jgi:rubrerythrin
MHRGTAANGVQARATREAGGASVVRMKTTATQKLTLECSDCGYGAVCAVPPERCPMCHGAGTWVDGRRPLRTPGTIGLGPV